MQITSLLWVSVASTVNEWNISLNVLSKSGFYYAFWLRARKRVGKGESRKASQRRWHFKWFLKNKQGLDWPRKGTDQFREKGTRLA